MLLLKGRIMFDNKPVLIVEDDPRVAMILVDKVAAMEGAVIGPVPTVAEALTMLDGATVAAAIMDANLADRDITPVALRLLHDHVPFVIYTGSGLPEGLACQSERIRVVMKPSDPTAILLEMVEREG